MKTFWEKTKQGLSEAFAVEDESTPYSEAELAILDKIAGAISKRELTTAAIMFLESVKPLTFIGSSVMAFLKPFATMVLKSEEEYSRLERILERRSSVELLIKKISEHDKSQSNGSGENEGK